MTDIDLDKLEALAKGATPGLEWFADMDGLKLKAEPPGNHFIPAEVTLALCATGDHAYRVLSYLAAANPATILDLIASARRDAEEIERLRAALKPFSDALDGYKPGFDHPDYDLEPLSLCAGEPVLDMITKGHLRAARAAHTGEG